MLASKERHADLERLTELIEAGKVTPSIDRTYPLDQARTPCATSKPERSRGKVVIVIERPDPRGPDRRAVPDGRP